MPPMLLPPADSCSPCPPGTFSEPGHAGACTPCPPGSYAPQQGAMGPPWCRGSGQLVPGNAADARALAAVHAGSPSCTPCPAGQYASNNGSTACTLCGDGHWSTAVGQASNTTCTRASAGHYATPPRTGIRPCEPGSSSLGGSQDACPACPVGTATNQTGAPLGCSRCLRGPRGNRWGGCCRCGTLLHFISKLSVHSQELWMRCASHRSDHLCAMR